MSAKNVRIFCGIEIEKKGERNSVNLHCLSFSFIFRFLFLLWHLFFSFFLFTPSCFTLFIYIYFTLSVLLCIFLSLFLFPISLFPFPFLFRAFFFTILFFSLSPSSSPSSRHYPHCPPPSFPAASPPRGLPPSMRNGQVSRQQRTPWAVSVCLFVCLRL